MFSQAHWPWSFRPAHMGPVPTVPRLCRGPDGQAAPLSAVISFVVVFTC